MGEESDGDRKPAVLACPYLTRASPGPHTHLFSAILLGKRAQRRGRIWQGLRNVSLCPDYQGVHSGAGWSAGAPDVSPKSRGPPHRQTRLERGPHPPRQETHGPWLTPATVSLTFLFSSTRGRSRKTGTGGLCELRQATRIAVGRGRTGNRDFPHKEIQTPHNQISSKSHRGPVRTTQLGGG